MCEGASNQSTDHKNYTAPGPLKQIDYFVYGWMDVLEKW